MTPLLRIVAAGLLAAAAAAQAQDANLGRNLAATCANCHGTNGQPRGETITAQLPAETGQWRLFLTYRATRGDDSLDVDRPDVWLVDLRLPNSSTEPLLGRGSLPAPAAPGLLILTGIGLLAVATRLTRRSGMGG